MITVLVVDDSMLIRHVVCRWLEERGFEVESASNGLEALNRISEKAPDVIITDLQMPNMSGVTHNIAFEAGEHGSSGPGPVLGSSKIISKGTVTLSLTLKPGTYTFFCEVPGHRQAGMYGALTVK